MPDPTPIDFTPLDPRRDPAEWERLVARVLRDVEAGPPAPEPAAVRLRAMRVVGTGE